MFLLPAYIICCSGLQSEKNTLKKHAMTTESVTLQGIPRNNSISKLRPQHSTPGDVYRFQSPWNNNFFLTILFSNHVIPLFVFPLMSLDLIDDDDDNK